MSGLIPVIVPFGFAVKESDCKDMKSGVHVCFNYNLILYTVLILRTYNNALG